MATLLVTLGLFLAMATIGTSQIIGDPGTEPWTYVVMTGCLMKGIQIQTAQQTALQCISGLTSGNPLAICGKKEERNACLQPYYEELKKCFHKTRGIKHVEQAFEAQEKGVDYFCEDGIKIFMGMTPADHCQPKDPQACIQQKMKGTFPEFHELFSEKNCKATNAYVDCMGEAFSDCGSGKMKEVMVGQMNAILSDTPCGEPETAPESGAEPEGEPSAESEPSGEEEPSSAAIAVFTVPMLLFTLFYNALTKFLF